MKEKKLSPPKVGDIKPVGGIQMQVLDVRETGGGATMQTMSAEPLARERGYRTRDEAAGFRIEHNPPPFVPRGVVRNPNALKDSDWNFVDLLKRPLEERRLALFHELARESARMREACRIYEAGLETEKQWNEKRAKAFQQMITTKKEAKSLKLEREQLKAALRSKTRRTKAEICEWKAMARASYRASKRARAADCEESHVTVMSCIGADRNEWNDAHKFLSDRLKCFPFGARGLLADWIAKDVPWREITVDERSKLIAQVKAIEAARRGGGMRHGLRIKDLPPSGEDWFFSSPIQFADKWSDGRAQYAYGDGLPGLPCLTSKGNGQDAERVLSESLELCVCLNFRDEDILEAFQAWLNWRRKSLHADLAEFKVSSKRPYAKLKGNNVDATLKGLAALRLRAALSPLEAAGEFDRIYFPNATHRKVDIGNVAKQAEKAKEWQEMFFKYCPLDSAGPVNPDLGPYDLECSLCYRVRRISKEPKRLPEYWIKLRCPVCDHRESMGWNGERWEPVDEDTGKTKDL